MIKANSIYKGTFDQIITSTSSTHTEEDSNNNKNTTSEQLQSQPQKQMQENESFQINIMKDQSTNNTTTTTTTITSPESVPINPTQQQHQYKPNKEPRLHPANQEDQGYQQILSALTTEEKQSMVDSNLIMRHYRADKGNIEKAIQRIKYAIQWRKDFNVENIIASVHNDESTISNEQLQLRKIIHHEGEPGKVYTRGYDKEGRAILYLYQARENTNNPTNNIKHLVYQIERTIAATEKNGHEKMVLILDFENWSIKQAPPMHVTKETIHILQECYVERMKRVYMTNAPVMFRTFWAMVKPFIDPVTKEKIVFCSGRNARGVMEEQFDLSVMEKSAYGTENLKPYDWKEYFDAPFDTVFDE